MRCSMKSLTFSCLIFALNLYFAQKGKVCSRLLGGDPLWFDSSKRPLCLCILGGRLRHVPTVLTYDLFPSPSF